MRLGLALCMVLLPLSAIAQTDDALGVAGYVFFVRYQYYGVAIVIDRLEDVHYLVTGLGIQVACRLISKNNRRVIYQCPGYGYTLALASDSAALLDALRPTATTGSPRRCASCTTNWPVWPVAP